MENDDENCNSGNKSSKGTKQNAKILTATTCLHSIGHTLLDQDPVKVQLGSIHSHLSGSGLGRESIRLI